MFAHSVKGRLRIRVKVDWPKLSGNLTSMSREGLHSNDGSRKLQSKNIAKSRRRDRKLSHKIERSYILC